VKRQIWRYRLTVRTEPSQGLNTGSIPVSATNSSYTYGLCAVTRCDAQRPSRFWHKQAQLFASSRSETVVLSRSGLRARGHSSRCAESAKSSLAIAVAVLPLI
jgi:hypothetical protein